MPPFKNKLAVSYVVITKGNSVLFFFFGKKTHQRHISWINKCTMLHGPSDKDKLLALFSLSQHIGFVQFIFSHV